MRHFNDSDIRFSEAISHVSRSIRLSLNDVADTFPEDLSSLLIDPPDGIYWLNAGVLPVVEFGKEYFRKNNLGELIKIHDVEKVVGNGVPIYDKHGKILMTDTESSFFNGIFYGRDYEVIQERAKRRTIPFLFLSSYIIGSLRDRICGQERTFDHLFRISYEDKVFCKTGLLDEFEGKYYIKSYDCYLKEALSSEQQESLDIALDNCVNDLINLLGIGKFHLPLVSGAVFNSVLEIKTGMDVRIISQILDEEVEKESQDQ